MNKLTHKIFIDFYLTIWINYSATKITPKRTTESGGVSFRNACQKSADHLAFTIDGKQKEFDASSYANVKMLLKNIQKSAYFEKFNNNDQSPITSTSEQQNENENVADNQIDDVSMNENQSTDQASHVLSEPTINANDSNEKATDELSENNNAIEFQEAPSASAVPVPTFGQPQQPHNVATPPINSHSASQNIKTLMQGEFWIFIYCISLEKSIIEN